MQTKIWLNVLLDESGSMSSRRDETILQYNRYIESQKSTKDALILATLTTFSWHPRHLYIARPVDHVPPLNTDGYLPDGGTALFDAIDASIQTVEQSMRREDEKTGVLFVIITDGEENSSLKIKDITTIREMIDKRKKLGWSFVYLGTEIDKWHGENLGIVGSVRVSANKSEQMYAALARGTALFAGCVDRGEQVDNILDLNAADYAEIGED